MVAPVFYDKNVSVLTAVVIDSAAGGDIILKAATPGLVTKLYRILFVVGGSTSIMYKDGVTEISGPFPFTAGGGMVLDFLQDPWYQTSLNSALILNSSAAVQVSGTAWIVQASS